MITGIYTITNILNNKIYIGFARNIDKRWIRHRKDLKNNSHHCKHLQDAYNKYGKDNFKFEVLVKCEKQFLASEEHYWSNMLGLYDENYGYNTRPTHPHGKVEQTKETRDKISASNIGKRRTDDSKKKMSDKALARFSKGDTPWNKGKKGFVVKEDVKEKIKQTMLSKHRNSNHGVGVLKRRPVLQYSLDGEFIKEWESLTEASLYFSGNKCSRIYKVCENNQKKAYNYYWKWKLPNNLQIVVNSVKKYYE